MNISTMDRTYLHERHRLSHQQIDRLLNETRPNNGIESIQDKMKQLEFVKNFLYITDLLRKNEIPVICIKGPLLSHRIYGDATVRDSHDIDLLVDVKYLERIEKLLLDEGYTGAYNFNWPKKKVQQELLLTILHHMSYRHKKHRFCVEIHWTLLNEFPANSNETWKLVNENLTQTFFAGRSFTVLNKELEVLYLMAHGAKHNWIRFKWLIDLKDYPFHDLDRKHFEKLVQQYNAQRIIDQTNYFLKRYFDLSLPFSGGTRLPSFLIQYAQMRIDQKNIQKKTFTDLLNDFRYDWLLFPGIAYHKKILLQPFFQIGDTTDHVFPCKAAYFLYRPYSLLKRRVFHG